MIQPAGGALIPASAAEGSSRSELPKGNEKIRHVIFIVMENRSFDHYSRR